jgi:flagellar assembly protein FliH
MSASQKFLFETAFDEPGSERNAKPLPTHTDEQGELIREEAYRAGHTAALAEARNLEESRIKDMLNMMGRHIATLSKTREADIQSIAEQVTDVALAICRKVLPELSRQHALTEIEGLIRACLAEMPEEPRIVVRVADGTVDQLQQRISGLANGFAGKLVLLGDDELAPPDCVVLWADGGTERNLERLWQDIDSATARLAALAPATETTVTGDDPSDAAATP